MLSLLEALPIELVEPIVTRLEFSDIASLRLTSRTIEAKASNGCFDSFLKHKKIELTTKTLQLFVQATEQGRRGCLLRHCTITGIARSDTTAHADSTKHERLPGKAFGNLKRWSPESSLASLSLCVTARVEDSKGGLVEPGEFRSGREVWKATLRTFLVAMAALRESQLPVTEKLDVFGSIRGCSLACDAFLANFAPESTLRRHIFGSSMRLIVSLSAPPKLDEAGTEHESESESEGEITAAELHAPRPAQESWQAHRILQEILHVLPTMPKLESLDLHCYPHFRECSLRGIHTSESDLVHFLSAIRPATVTLTDVRLISGTYGPVFQYLTSRDSPVTSYHLDDVLGTSKFRYSGVIMGPSTLSREGGHVKEVIPYCFSSRRVMGSGERNRWRRSKAQEFGGPDRDAYDFVKLNSEDATIVADDDGSDND
ncbi:hypothetical protein QBC33DRAFT_613234 [Phialemonium atrogriseum]|uniref:F-box domain-containing protein n=1 Tax=Phialemonium atrogriseum TaxID=1093897 RepID=A0AAJ0BWA6_9PEZI|nr:uncharacterized protein QBC33DRAFT_613234 [Phialemonium atrogriseum]KAK1764284.1 hypothetical protein QBC33DRAFT_613234 [Phialemonium atrogriseum]